MDEDGKGMVELYEHFLAFSTKNVRVIWWRTIPNIIYHLQQIDASGEIHLSDATKKILAPSDKWSGEVVMYNLSLRTKIY